MTWSWGGNELRGAGFREDRGLGGVAAVVAAPARRQSPGRAAPRAPEIRVRVSDGYVVPHQLRRQVSPERTANPYTGVHGAGVDSQ